MGKVITITSRKGGVGKSTTLLNLAGVFSNLKKKVLIIDLDFYSSSISISLNLKNEKNIYNLVLDISNNKFSSIDDYVEHYNDYISILSSSTDPRINSQIETRYLEQIINMARHSVDVLLIDTSHILDHNNLVIFDNSDTILNVMSNDPVDLVNTKNFINIARDVEFPDLRILLNESNSLEEKYFSDFDIREFLEYNISYKLGSDFFVKTIDKYVLDGKILTLNNVYKNNYKKLENIAIDLIKENT
ncbi:MAG: AAA family ATPase [Bacilli bacterium]|nr:AAA family ATPase [Bacilli bacterium]